MPRENATYLYTAAEDDAQVFGLPANLLSAPVTAAFRPPGAAQPGMYAVRSAPAEMRTRTASGGNKSYLIQLRPGPVALTTAGLLALVPPPPQLL
jgi:hypothetical protein